MSEERGAVTDVGDDGTVTATVAGKTVTLQMGPERVRDEDWRPGRPIVVEFADDGITVETFDLVD